MSNWRDHIQVIVVPLPGQSEERAEEIRKATEAKVDEMIEKMGDE
jgi:hypothetical protein